MRQPERHCGQAAADIHCIRNGFQMRCANAGCYTAQVVKYHAFRNLAIRDLVRYAVGTARPTSDTDLAMTRGIERPEKHVAPASIFGKYEGQP